MLLQIYFVLLYIILISQLTVMNIQSKFSQKKPESRSRTLQTLPCQSSNDHMQFDSLSPQDVHHSSSIKLFNEHNNCSSPTFASCDIISLNSLRIGQKDKQNNDENIDWKQEARMKKGANLKLSQSNQLLESQNEELKKKLEICKKQLNKKLQDFKFFRKYDYYNSSKDRQMVDMYLEFMEMQPTFQAMIDQMKTLKSELNSKEKQTEHLKAKQEKSTKDIKQVNDVLDKLAAANKQLKQKLEISNKEYQKIKFLRQEVDKQRQVAVRRTKELEFQLDIAKKSVSESMEEQQNRFLETQKCKNQMVKFQEQLQKSHEHSQKLKCEIQELILQHNKQIEGYEDKLKSSQKHIYDLEREVARSISDSDVAKKKIDKIQSSNQEMIQTLEMQINRLRQCIQEQMEKKEALQLKLETSSVAFRKYQSQISQLKQSKISLQKNSFLREQELQQLRKKIQNYSTFQQTLVKQNQFYRQKVQCLQKEVKQIQDIKNYEIDLKVQVIRKLVKFVPNEAKDLLEEYLIFMQEIISCETEMEDKKPKILDEVNEAISNNIQKIRQLQETAKKYHDLLIQYQNLRKSIPSNETRRTQSNLQTHRRRLIDKYYN